MLCWQRVSPSVCHATTQCFCVNTGWHIYLTAIYTEHEWLFVKTTSLATVSNKISVDNRNILCPDMSHIPIKLFPLCSTHEGAWNMHNTHLLIIVLPKFTYLSMFCIRQLIRTFSNANQLEQQMMWANKLTLAKCVLAKPGLYLFDIALQVEKYYSSSVMTGDIC